MSRGNRSVDPGAFIWGLLFAMTAGLGIALGLGIHPPWHHLIVIGPLILVAVGALALVLTITTKGHRT